MRKLSRVNREELESIRSLWALIYRFGLCPNQTLTWQVNSFFYETTYKVNIARFY